jgi:AraC-like DNA-binding protein
MLPAAEARSATEPPEVRLDLSLPENAGISKSSASKIRQERSTMPSQTEKSGRHRREQGRFSDYGELGRPGGWDLDFRQLDPGPPSISASIVGTDRMSLMKMRFDCGFHQTGCAPPGTLTFGLPLEGMRDWFGRPYAAESILPFNFASGVDGVSQRGFEAFTLSIDVDFLQNVSASHQIPVPDQFFAPIAGASIQNRQAAQKLRRAIHSLIDDDTAQFDADQEIALVIELLNSADVESPSGNQIAPHARSRAISAALGFLEQHQREAPTVARVCRETGVSWRTLDRAFKERFGIGPKVYLQHLRLDGVRADLANRSGNDRIADVANAWGFWHMGQFARDYRRLFGELPSETSSSRRS